jgi:hypothetical protein
VNVLTGSVTIDAALDNRVEEIAIGHDAQSLIPRVTIAGASVITGAPLPLTTTRLPTLSTLRGPVLRVHDAAAEPLHPLEVGRVALVVAVIAAAHET